MSTRAVALRWLLAGVASFLLSASLVGCDFEADETCTPACAADLTCQNGACVPAGAGGAGVNAPIGSACTDNAQCASGTCFASDAFAGGYCSDYCGAQVVANKAQCPTGAQCLQVSEAVAVCLDRCGGANGTCRTGYRCADIGGGQACIPNCKSSDDCPAQTHCDTGSGACIANGAASTGQIGSPCSDNAACQSGICVDEAGSSGVWKGGYCIAQCAAGDDGQPCKLADGTTDGLCTGLPDDQGQSVYICLAGCNTGVDCRGDYMCTSGIGVTAQNGQGVCLPSCTTYGCESGQVCDPQSGVCVAASKVASSVEHIALGSVQVGDKANQFKTVTVSLPADAVSVTLYARPSNLSEQPVLTKAVQPSGKVVLDIFDPLATDFKVVPVMTGANAMLYPNTPRLSAPAGKYQFTFGAMQNTTLQVDAVIKRASGLLSSGSLPVTLWFTQQGRLNATTAQTDANFQAALQTFVSIYAKIGIQVGPFAYRDVQGPLATSAAVIDDDAEQTALFATADSSPDAALNFFLIEQYAGGEQGYVTLGQSGGIPGPPSFVGLPQGGVAVALAYLDDSVETFASTMAHEAGHFLGLFHTSEADGQSFDPLLDTAQCSISQDGNGDGKVSDSECASSGGDNLMFWLAGPTHTTLSPDQRYVLLRNPMVQTAQ